ncbi:MAG: carboxypeptidase regulatory-like domain-containing protein [Vicinamibacterales bacterium]
MTRVLRGMLLVAAMIGMTAGSANAQAIGSIFGKATDSSGGVLPGVTVTVSGGALQQPLTQVTTESGAYQFPVVPIGNYTVTFELTGFKRVSRQNVPVTSGFNAEINATMEVGAMTEEVTVSAAAPVVDTKKTTTGATFTADILEKIPTARDPWQIINMTPGVQAGLNVGGSSSGQQVGLSSRGTAASVQWNLEGGSMTDLSSNSSAMYYNFDSFEQISVTNGGGDVSVQSSGLSINLVTKSGSNVFKGSVVGTFQNDKFQSNNVSEEYFKRGTTGFLSGAPVFKIYNISGEYGGPLVKNRLWWWVALDKQDINAGVVNFFDRAASDVCNGYADSQRAGSLLGSISYGDLKSIKDCLKNDKTVIKNKQGKINFQLNAANKFQYLFISDNKYRNARGASDSTELEAVTKQTSDTWLKYFPLPTHQLTHTWIANDRLVFNTMLTHVAGGFYLDYQDSISPEICGLTKYTGKPELSSYPQTANPDCMFNIQPQTIRTTGNLSRSLGNSYQTVRPSLEIKTDGTYFVTNVLGGDHSFKFGAGYRNNPITTYNHISGGGRATVQCVGNSLNNCLDGKTYVPVGSAAGLVPYSAVLTRDSLTNNDWWMWSGYIQDSYSRGRLRVNAGLRYDWQQSKWLGGCVPENPIVPNMLPSQCEGETSSGISAITGQVEEIQPFGNLSPRVSLTYDLTGNGKTVLKASGSYYYATKITLANAFSSLGGVTLTWGNNQNSGACSTAANAPCWTDANRDGYIQSNELIGTPNSNTSRFDLTTGVLAPGQNAVDKSAKIGRTREVTLGVQRELVGNLAVGADFIYRRYDNGTAGFQIGYQPGTAGYDLQLYSGPLTHTDATTGLSANYYIIPSTTRRPTGTTGITLTRLSYETYKGVDLTMNKRYSDKWQANVAVTIQTRNDYSGPLGALSNPTGNEYFDGFNSIARYLIKFNGSYDLPWGIMASTNLNINDGGIRNMSINGPGVQPLGTAVNVVTGATAASTINYATLNFEKTGNVRFERQAIWDMGIHKTFTFRGGQNRLKVMLDGFNILNNDLITGYSSNNLSLLGSTSNPIIPAERISSIIPPRIFRVGATFSF